MMFTSAALAGSVVGFLFFNFNPARIFMGDTGSMFLGFILLAELLLIFGSWVIAPGVAGLKAAPLPANAGALTNTRALGELLYTRYIFAFQAAGVILLVAMIGAIVLTLRARVGVRHQSIARQLARTRAESVEVVKVPIGGGVGD